MSVTSVNNISIQNGHESQKSALHGYFGISDSSICDLAVYKILAMFGFCDLLKYHDSNPYSSFGATGSGLEITIALQNLHYVV